MSEHDEHRLTEIVSNLAADAVAATDGDVALAGALLVAGGYSLVAQAFGPERAAQWLQAQALTAPASESEASPSARLH